MSDSLAGTEVKQATAERVARVCESAADVSARIGRSPKIMIAAVFAAGAVLAILARRRR